MQQYFVQRRAEPVVSSIEYAGARSAKPSPGFTEAMDQGGMLVLCPSNPFLSLAPILAMPGVRPALEAFPGPRVAVSPIVAGAAVRGPAAKIMTELGKDASVVGVAREYAGICDYFLIDHQDSSLAPEIAELGINPVVDSIIMHTNEDKVALARRILDLNSDQV